MLAALLVVSAANQADTCLAFVASNLAKGNNNHFCYATFAQQKITVAPGDVFSYEVLLMPTNPTAKGGVDVSFDQGADLRDRSLFDQHGIRVHGDGMIDAASGTWLLRKIDLTPLAGRETRSFNMQFEGDEFGEYVQFIDNVKIDHRDGTTTPVYFDGSVPRKGSVSASGYTQHPMLLSIDRAKVSSPFTRLLESLKARAERLAKFDRLRSDLVVADQAEKQNPNADLRKHIEESKVLLERIESSDDVSELELTTAMHEVQRSLAHAHEVMEKYTGHLVGHAHIDLQWLWEWQEGLVVSYDTFKQADKFMGEFPGFTFSQSSSWIYQAVEESYPELFKNVQNRVKKGQWELVGGRVCEGDTNMISGEAHAREFLFGQSYFREKFKKSAVVGWEPDTFGHTAQMPQIAKLGGLDYYYFCRGGKGKPLFWWAALDGTRVLAFEEPATDSWYNSDLSYKQFAEMFEFREQTGSNDMLWVYGVGNHGGGPTRESIEQALAFQKNPNLPKVQFSTATQFFKRLEQYPLDKIPVIQSELNPVFEGCYTTQADIKQLNRFSECATTSAESLSAVATLFGVKYPGALFRRMWEDISFNHHHDTLPGSGVHATYDKSRSMLTRVVHEANDVAMRAMEVLSTRVTAPSGGVSFMVFNPLGWNRDVEVETYAAQSGWDGSSRLDITKSIAKDPEGNISAVKVLDAQTKRVRVLVKEVPAFGWKVIQIVNGTAPIPQIPKIAADFNRDQGGVNSLKLEGQEFVPSGQQLARLEVHYEGLEGMSAWTLGKTTKVEKLVPLADETKSGSTSLRYELKHNGTVTPITMSLAHSHDGVDVTVTADWQVVADGRTPTPSLRIAFPTTGTHGWYGVPFGALERTNDGHEQPGLYWLASESDSGGVAVLNNCKYGMSNERGTLRVTLLRGSTNPDPKPNMGPHTVKLRIVPYKGSWKTAGIQQKAIEFNQPAYVATVPYDAKGSAPLKWSLINQMPGDIVVTNVKKAEKSDQLVLRMFNATGNPSSAKLASAVPIKSSRWVNFLEDPISAATMADGQVEVSTRGFEIKSLLLNLTK